MVPLQILIQHRAPDEKMRLVERILAPLNSRYVHMSYDEHDEVTANTQAVTHAAFLRSVFSAPVPSRTDEYAAAWERLGSAWNDFLGKRDDTLAESKS